MIATSSTENPPKSHLPFFPLFGQSREQLEGFLQILFPKWEKSQNNNFVLTADNVIKMGVLKLLVLAKIPVVFMGETGSGKTTLVKYFGKITNIPVFTLDLHGGIEEIDIIAFLGQIQQVVMHQNLPQAIVFFDEINTSPSADLLKEVVCDRTIRGKPINNKISVLAACNPYLEVAQSPVLTNVNPHLPIPAKNLKYKVYPLHDTLARYVWDFGSLSEKDLREYISAMTQSSLTQSGLTPQSRDKLAQNLPPIIFAAQEFSKSVRSELVFPVSLRDIERSIVLTSWFLKISDYPQV